MNERALRENLKKDTLDMVYNTKRERDLSWPCVCFHHPALFEAKNETLVVYPTRRGYSPGRDSRGGFLTGNRPRLHSRPSLFKKPPPLSEPITLKRKEKSCPKEKRVPTNEAYDLFVLVAAYSDHLTCGVAAFFLHKALLFFSFHTLYFLCHAISLFLELICSHLEAVLGLQKSSLIKGRPIS